MSATQEVEGRICERLHIGGHISYRRLLEDLAGLGYSNNQVGLRALDGMRFMTHHHAAGGSCTSLACARVGDWTLTHCAAAAACVQVGLAVKVMLSRGQLRRKAEGKMLERTQ